MENAQRIYRLIGRFVCGWMETILCFSELLNLCSVWMILLLCFFEYPASDGGSDYFGLIEVEHVSIGMIIYDQVVFFC